MRFSNRVPLLFDNGGCAITETIKSIDWKRYDIKNFDEEPLAVLVNLASVHVPYTSAGKQAISIEEDVMDEIRFAVMEASRGVQKYLSGKRKAHDIATKKKVVERYASQLASDLATLTGKRKSEIEPRIAKIIQDKYANEAAEEEEAKPPEKGDDKAESEGGDEE
jgi:DNA topoisomerase-6 subunit B